MSKGKKRTTGPNVKTGLHASLKKEKDKQSTGLNSMTNWIVILLAVLPILFSNVTMDPNISVRYLFLAIFVFLFLLYFFVFRKTTINYSLPPIVKAVFILGICFGIWNIISTSSSINKAASYYEIVRHWLYLILLFIVMIAVSREEAKIVKLCKTLIVVSIIQSFVGIFQYYELAFTEIPGGNAFPFGLMGNRNLFGSAQAFTLPFVLFSLYKGSKPWKYAAIISILLIIVSVIISQTRSAWISTVSIGFISLILVAIFSREDLKRWAMGTGIAIASTFIVILFLFATEKDNSFSTSVKERAMSLAGTAPDSSSVTGNATERVRIWKKTIQLINDRPVFGAGPGNWKMLIPSYGTAGMVWSTGKFVPDRPHNEYLRVAADTGLPGAILYFGMWILMGIMAFKIIIGSASRDKILAILMLAGLAGFASDCMFSFPTERIEHSLYTILMWGIILGTYLREYIKDKGKQQRIKKWIMGIALIIVALNIFIAYKKYDFEVHVKLAKGYENEARFIEEIDVAEAGKNSFVTVDPNGYPLEVRTGNAYHELKNYQLALREMEKALKYNPYSATIYTNMGTIYTDMKLYMKAIECYEKALRINPAYDIALKNLAVNYFETGNYSECIKTLYKVDIKNDSFLSGLLIEATNKLKK